MFVYLVPHATTTHHTTATNISHLRSPLSITSNNADIMKNYLVNKTLKTN
ncbi:hypothetical protein Hanom_Chr14g01303871 [Helianthus anomalus]